ncbi:hypothetical protein B0T16DRAFT_388725 [Cercophora newfieldiana]|uniref:Uncharacterized protein n=1 Tax=Cercophora newfieldiana TaxID=92897 RepID=A0AA39Y9N1_9PEZI|nr:hypothetical protein B0T16DRAFT_388725 [Cercophora newfieldiana]
MKTAVILLSLAALGLARPRLDFGLSVEARQETCLYDIFCRSPLPARMSIPTRPGAALWSAALCMRRALYAQCLDLTHAQGTAYATCCAGSYAYARSHNDCPDIDVRL